MIESLRCRNFQCHENTLIEFSPTITSLVGESDAGKTAILRCLRFVCLNQPSGIAFVRHGEESTTGILKVDGHKIVRKRGRDVNSYAIDGEKYVAFGQGNVPDDIAKLLNVDGINFQNQLSSPFWFSLTPGQVSKELNGIVNLDVIDNTLTNVGTEVRKAKTTVEVSADRLKQARDERDKYMDTVQIDEQLRSLETVQLSIKENRSKIDAVSFLLNQCSDARSRQENASYVVLDVLPLIERGERLSELQERIKSLSSLLDSVAKLNTIASQEIPDVDSLQLVAAIMKEKTEQIDRLETLLWEIEKARERVERCEREEAETRRELEVLMGETCPLCGRSP